MAQEKDIRRQIVASCRDMNMKGINQGTSGNISARHGTHMLISPSAIAYDAMTPEMVASLDLAGDMTGAFEGPEKPSTEWRFHWKLLKHRPEAGAVVHAHSPYATTLAMLRQPIPACHYMIAAFGGNDVKCAGYATFGTEELADLAVEALHERTACLLANHGMIALGATIAEAMWRAVELETIARQYHQALLVGAPVLLSDAQITATKEMFAGYGLKK